MVDLIDQLPVIHHVAAIYWQQDESQIKSSLDSIVVIKRTGGKVAGFLPAFQDYPSTFFKVYFYERGFRFETAGLQAASQMPQLEGVSVPRVVAILPEYQAILSERRAWLDTTSQWKRFMVSSLKIDWAWVGAWLRAFHDSQVLSERNDYFLRKKFEKIEAHLAALQHLFTPAQLEKMRHIVESARVHFKTGPCQWVLSHGDFGLDNIKKLADGSLEIIDFEDCQPAPREFDILNCLARLEYAGSFPYRPATYQVIHDGFLQGYGMPLERSPIYDFFYLLIKLDMLETYERRKEEDQLNSLQKIKFCRFSNLVFNTIILWLE